MYLSSIMITIIVYAGLAIHPPPAHTCYSDVEVFAQAGSSVGPSSSKPRDRATIMSLIGNNI